MKQETRSGTVRLAVIWVLLAGISWAATAATSFAGDIFRPDFSRLADKGIPDLSVQENNLLFPERAEQRPVTAAGPEGMPALSFSGSQYVFTAPDVSLVPFSALKIEAWVYQDEGAGPNVEQRIIRAGNPKNLYECWCLKTVGNNRLRFTLNGVSYGNLIVAEDGSWTAGKWHRVLAFYDGAAVTLTVDGREKARIPYASGLYYGGLAAENAYYNAYYEKHNQKSQPLASRDWFALNLGGSLSGGFFKGKIADLKVSSGEFVLPADRNIFFGGNFETPGTAGWTVNSGGTEAVEIDNAVSFSGKGSLKVYLTKEKKTGYITSYLIPVVSGATYTLSFRAKTSGEMSREQGYCYLGVNPGFTTSKKFKSGKEWEVVEHTVTMPANLDSRFVYVVIGLTDYPEPLWVDDLAVTLTKAGAGR